LAITLDEDLFSFPDAPESLPRRRGGRKIHVSTWYRWATIGLRGVVLETIQVGGTRCSSRQALERFFERLSTKEGVLSDAESPRRVRSAARRRREAELAARELTELGA
jgi:hypothetical protein